MFYLLILGQQAILPSFTSHMNLNLLKIHDLRSVCRLIQYYLIPDTQVGDLKDLVGRLRADKKMSSSESAELAEKRTALVAKLEDFESANRQLRTLLQSQHSAQVEAEQEAEQRQMLLRKLTEVDAVCQRQQKHIDDKSKLLSETSQALMAAQDQNKALLS